MLDFPAVNCTEPPEKPGAGTWEWNGELIFETEILYTCGPYGNFLRSFHQSTLKLACYQIVRRRVDFTRSW